MQKIEKCCIGIKEKWSIGIKKVNRDKKKANKDKKKSPMKDHRTLVKLAATYSPTWYSSTIGANGLNFSVRNGKRWIPVAIATLRFLPFKAYIM